jgi:outer membrane protein
MRTLSSILLLCMTLACPPAFGRTLTLEECVELVMERNSGLKASRAASLSAAEDVTMSRADLLPALKLKSYYTFIDKADRLIIDSNAFAPGLPAQKTTLSLGERDSYGVGLTLRQPLFTGGSLTNAHQLAKHEASAATYEYSRQRTLLLFQVKKTFNEALIAASRIHAAESAVKAAGERIKVAEARREEGFADQEEVLRREADLAMARTRLIKSRNRSTLVLGKLRQLTGSGPDEEIEIVGKPAKLTLTGGLEELTKGARERREDIRSATEKSAAAESGVRMARSGFLPQIFLEGNYLRQKETRIARPELWSLTVQAEWSLFEWGRTSASVRKAVARHNQLDLAREELSRTAQLEIEETWQEVVELQSQVIAYEKLVKANEATFTKTITMYLEGAVRFDEVISTESALWESYDMYCQSAASLSSAFSALEASTSALLDQWTLSEELYRPDFESYENLIKSYYLTRVKKHSEKTPVAARPATGLQRDSSQQPGLYVQLGAYASRKSAEDVRTSLAPHCNGKQIEILAEGRFFKPVVGPFTSREAARNAADALGIKEYLIRSDHGSRTVSP